MRTVSARRAAACLVLAQLALALPGATPAAAVYGNPLRVDVYDDLGCEVESAADAPDYAAFSCGTFLAVGDTPATSRLFGPAYLYGGESITRETWTATGASAWAGGSVEHDVAAGDTGVSLTEVDSYVAGQEVVRTDVTVTAGSVAAQGVLYRTALCWYGGGSTRVDLSTAYPSPLCTKDTGPNPPHGEWVPLGGPADYAAGSDADVFPTIGAHEAFTGSCTCTSTARTAAGLSWSWSLAPGESVTFSHLTDFGGHRELYGVGTASPESVQPGEGVTYTVGVHNPNFHPVVVSTITHALGYGFTYQPGSTTGAAEPTSSGSTLTWSGPWTVPARSAVQVTFRATAGSLLGYPFATNVGGTAVDVGVRTELTAPVTVLWRTTVAAAPIVPEPGPVPGETAGRFRARLTVSDTGVPLEGKFMTVTMGSGAICRGFTDSDGWLSCRATDYGFWAGAGTFHAVFPREESHWYFGGAEYEGSSDVFPVAKVGAVDVVPPDRYVL